MTAHCGKCVRSRVLVIIAAFLLTACGAWTRVVYEQAETLLTFTANDYLALSNAQRSLLKQRFTAFQQWHRHDELPQLARLADDAGARVKRGLSPADVTWANNELRSVYARLVTRGVEDALPVVVTLDEQNLGALARKFDRSTAKLEHEYLKGDPRETQNRRIRAVEKPLRDWLGSVTDPQRALIRDYAEGSPQFGQQRFDARRTRQAALITTLRSRTSHAELRSRLQHYFSEDSLTTINLSEAGVRDFILAIDRTMTVPQRAHLAAKLHGFSVDFRHLGQGPSG